MVAIAMAVDGVFHEDGVEPRLLLNRPAWNGELSWPARKRLPGY
jgi:hypothetical protein